MDIKAKKFFLITSYYRSYIFLLIGLLMLVYSIINITKKLDDYSKTQGTINHVQIRWHSSPFDIELKGEKWFHIYDKKLFPLLKDKVKPGKKATIWYNDDYLIEQLQVEGEIIYPYSKATWLWVIVMLFGIGLSVGNIVYLIRYPSHAEGKDDKINE